MSVKFEQFIEFQHYDRTIRWFRKHI